MGDMSKALNGTHLCEKHQGNQSHYDPLNCEICNLRKDVSALRSQLATVMDERHEMHDRLLTRAEKAESELAEATRLQKKAEMLLESSEQLRAGMEVELQQVKGERDRLVTALKFYAQERIWVEIESDRGNIARAALHPATETTTTPNQFANAGKPIADIRSDTEGEK